MPVSTAISFVKLRISRPALASSTTASATLETTSMACRRCWRAPPMLRAPPSRSRSVRSRRSLTTSGSNPKTMAVSADSANVKSTTRPSSRTSCTPGRPSVITSGIARTTALPMNKPSAPPAAVSSRPSTSSICSKRRRPAPSAARTLISRWRVTARLSTRFATFAHATSSTSPTAPSRISNGLWTCPAISSMSGTAVTMSELIGPWSMGG